MAQTPGDVLEYLRRLATPPALASAPDEVLLRLFNQEHDEAAFAVLLHRHGPMVLAACRRLLPSAQDAEDAFQGTFVVLVRRAGQIGRPERLAPWLYGVALRIAGKLRRRRPTSPLPAALPDPALSADRELGAALDEELARLPARYREPLVLCCLSGLSRDEAAERLGVRPAVVKGLLERGRERLRQRLTRRGVLDCLPVAIPAPALPLRLASATVEAAARGAVPAAVAVVVKGVLADMTLSRWKTALSLALLALACSGVGLTMQPGEAARPITPQKDGKATRPGAPAPVPPLPPDRIHPGAYLFIQVPNAFVTEPIHATYRVEPSGKVALGPSYGRVEVKGLTVEEAEQAVLRHLGKIIKDPKIMITWGSPPLLEPSEIAAFKRRMDELEKEVRSLRSAVDKLQKRAK